MSVKDVEIVKDWTPSDEEEKLLPNPYFAIEFLKLDGDNVETEIYVGGLTPEHYEALIQFLPYLAQQLEYAQDTE